MQTRKHGILWIGAVLLLAGALLSACVVNPPATGAPTPAATQIVPYPPNLYPGSGGMPAYPGPDETLSPDTPVTAPVYPPADQPLTTQPPAGGTPDLQSGVPPEFAPVPGDAALQRGEVFLDSQSVLTLESYPPQFMLALEGSLPTPCHALRVAIEPPNENNEVIVTAYSVVDPATICTQVLKPFNANIPLRGLPSGTYTVAVNGTSAGQITVP